MSIHQSNETKTFFDRKGMKNEKQRIISNVQEFTNLLERVEYGLKKKKIIIALLATIIIRDHFRSLVVLDGALVWYALSE